MKKGIIFLGLLSLCMQVEAQTFVYGTMTYRILSDTTVELLPTPPAVSINSNELSNYSKLGLTVPAIVSFDGVNYLVTHVGEYAFQDYSALKTLILPYSVTHIGKAAFRGCTQLRTIQIPESIQQVDAEAMDSTAWWDAQPVGLVYIGRVLYAYKGQRETVHSLMLRAGTISITPGALSGFTQLKQLAVPKGFLFEESNLLDKVKIVYY